MAGGSDLTGMDGVFDGNEVHVWHTDLAVGQTAIDELNSLLDHHEHSRAGRFLVPEPRVQFILSRAFLRIVIGKYLGIEPGNVRFRTGEQGKPELAEGRELHFNLSHTEGQTVIAITRAGRVGVDVERVRKNLEPLALAARFFSVKESEWLRSQPADQRFAAFFACWAAKEAYIKACGGGLSIPLGSFGVIPHQSDFELKLELYDRPEESSRWSMWQLDLGTDLRSAVAVEAVGCQIRVGRWSL